MQRRAPWRGGRSRRATCARGVAPAYGTMRTQPAAAGRFIDAEDVRLQRRVGVPRQRGGAEAVRQPAGGRRDRPHQRHGVRGRRRAEGEGAALQLRPARQGERVHPATRRPASCGTPSTSARSSTRRWIRRSATRDRRQVKELLGKRLRFNPADERALRIFGSARDRRRSPAGIVLGLKLVLGVHRRADAGDRRRRRDEHHVRVGDRADARDRPAQGAGREAPRDPLQFLLEGLATTFAGGAVGRGAVLRAGVAGQPAAVPVGAARRHARAPPTST